MCVDQIIDLPKSFWIYHGESSTPQCQACSADGSNDDVSSNAVVSLDSASQASVCPGWRLQYHRYIKPYWPPPPKIWMQQTNKHKSYHSCVSMVEYTDDENLVPGLSDCFHTHYSFLLDDTNTNLLASQYDSVLQDDVNGELYFDALNNIDSDLDKYPGCYVNVGDFTCSDNNPLSIYWDPGQCSAHAHGELIYWYISGADVPVFITESKDDGTLPHNHSFWVNCFHHKNVSRCIYQGVLDYAADVGINSWN